MIKRLSLGLISVALAIGTATAHAQAREEARLLNAQQVLKDLHSSPDQFVPQQLLERAYGIAIIPDVTKAAFFLGGARGNGVLVVRDKSGRFSDPIFVNLTGGSFGFQWGIQSTDVVLVFTSQRSIDKITSGKLTLGADASIAAGPVGRQASAATDPTFHSEVYSYSRSRGLFAGLALSGNALTIDNGADARFYDRGTADAAAIAEGSIRTHDDIARRFLSAVNTATGAELPASASAAPASSPPSYSASENSESGSAAARQGSSSDSAPAAGSQAATTYPLADPHPGAEPPR
ncbi:MAG TPA: lipid-binding SYLF domain-containing protein [Steroidobacteraceae bacterium]|nr:lipid-binding SYLF domain-containing protein [Steroidobacteraceae bacterium]